MCGSHVYTHTRTPEHNVLAHFLLETQASESQVPLAGLAAPQASPLLAAFQSPLGGQSFPNQGRERAQSLDRSTFLSEAPCYSPDPTPGLSQVCP